MAEKEKVETDAEMFAKMKDYYKLTLSKFQKFHDLIREAPDLYTKETIIHVDTVASSFRDMGKESSSITRKAASGYLNIAIIFYQTIETLDTENIMTMLTLIGGQVKQFEKVFKAIFVWGGWLSGQFLEIHDEMLAEVPTYKDRYAEAVAKAKKAMDSASDILQKAKTDLKASKDSAEHWKKLAHAKLLIDNATTSRAKTEMEHYKAVKAEEQKDEQAYDEANQKLQAAISKEERAKVRFLHDEFHDMVLTNSFDLPVLNYV